MFSRALFLRPSISSFLQTSARTPFKLSFSQYRFLTLPPSISYEEFEEHRRNKSALIVDVREVKELKASGEVPGAKNIPLSVFKLAFDLKEDSFHEQYDAKVPAPNDPIITFCLSGVRSEMARSILVDELGYENVANFEGSFAEWSNKKRN